MDNKTGTIQLRIESECLKALDDWRSKQRPILTRSAAIRALIYRAVKK